MVILSTRNWKSKRPNKKFPNKTIGSFIIKKRIGKKINSLAKIFIYKIYPIFHVPLSEFYKRKTNNNVLPVRRKMGNRAFFRTGVKKTKFNI